MLIAATRYHDCEAALAFLTDVFGLVPAGVYRDDSGRIQHAQMMLGTGMLMFGPEQGGAFDAFMAHPSDTGGRATVSLYAVVTDLDAVHGRCVAAGCTLLMPLREESYGGRSFSVRDCEGHVWTFGTYDPFALDPATLAG
ncbi:glyoxalase [Fertoebacter nigrum]|uniref:Glyoxalase n=1 Tax=Fertoeibacter niger TaxID=2656921 RepID=A0A8X8GYK9_9RHOB|nr:VOC family protein [Fertoeibacter niger]NUB42854.1 glyoxalase [Fertoeibacter niger]